MTTRIFAAALIAISLASTSAQARLTPVEQRIIAAVDADQARQLSLLERLVNQNSGSHNIDGVTRVGAMMDAEFKALGFQTRWIDMRAAGRAGHLIATHKGNGRGKRLLLIGHLDTVFEPDSPFQQWKRTGNDGTGPGAGDDKGGIVTILSALRAMKSAGTLASADIEVVLTGDEEDTGSPLDLARRDLVDAGKRADVALDFEGLSVDDGKDMGVIARRGSMSWTVKATAIPSHSSGIFSKASGYGAIYELVRILDDFRRQLTDDKLTYNVGLIGGGQTAALDQGEIRLEATGKTNIIPAVAVARGDLRALTPQQVDRTRAKMAAIVANHLPGTNASIEFGVDAYPPMAPTAGNRALLARLNAVNADLGLAAQAELDPLKRGAGDISFVAADVDGLVGLGPASIGDHAPGETVDIASIWRQAKRAAILMSRLAAEPR
ncbi:M20/M25/M40 family metallo-hydrolase [Sphingomonas jaspsi]|uniref:M20/M25/M40 family metallo-hydrolase n=1 Tax=Sphingomonas jaspsi TaxID=392409 RepID=UPI0004B7835A|nr:M20/M25/M40 family metallo-hydrolase [Sphingomonas jaspsi]